MYDWFLANKLLNDEKTQNVVFTLLNQDDSEKSAKFMGITVDIKLLRHEHAECLASSISSSVFLLRSLNTLASKSVLLSAYYASVQSRITYGLIVWGHASAASRIFKLQRKAV